MQEFNLVNSLFMSAINRLTQRHDLDVMDVYITETIVGRWLTVEEILKELNVSSAFQDKVISRLAHLNKEQLVALSSDASSYTITNKGAHCLCRAKYRLDEAYTDDNLPYVTLMWQNGNLKGLIFNEAQLQDVLCFPEA